MAGFKPFFNGTDGDPFYKAPDNFLSGLIFYLFQILLEISNHYTFLGNCPPTPPLSQH